MFSVMSKTPDRKGHTVQLHLYEIQGQTKLIYDDKVRLRDMDFRNGHEGIFWRDGHILSWFGWWIHRYIHAYKFLELKLKICAVHLSK